MRQCYYLLITFCLTISVAEAQIGKLKGLGKKAGGLVGNVLDKKGQNLQAEQFTKDTTSFSMVLALSDNASSFDTKADNQNLVLSAMKMSGKVDTDQSRAELAMDYNRAGFKLYNLNRLSLAETKFMEALLLFFQTEQQARRQQQNRNSIGDTFVFTALYSNLFEELQLDEYVDTQNFSRGDYFAYTKTLSNLGLVNHSAGRYRLAERYALKVLEVVHEAFGADHPAVAAAQNNLAILRKDQGQYTSAEELMASAEQNMRQAGKQGEIDFAILLNNKAMLLHTFGRYQAAEELYVEAIALGEEDLNEQNRDLSKIYINMALLYKDMGNYQKATKAYDDLISIKKKRFGTNSPDYAYILNNKAALLVEMGRMEEASGLLGEALEIYERRLGKAHPSYVSSLYNLGWVNLQQSNFEVAQTQLEQAFEGRKTLFGSNHPATTQSEQALAVLHWQKGEPAQAKVYFSEVIAQYLYQVREYFPAMSEHEKAKFWAKISPSLNIFKSFAVAYGDKDPEVLTMFYDLQLATKGLLLSATTRVRQLILQGEDKALKDTYLQWLDQKEQLAHYYSYSKERLLEENVNLDSLERIANKTEKTLSAQSDLFSQGQEVAAANFGQVQAQLPDGAVAIEIVRLEGYKHGEPGKTDLQYIALVAKPGQPHPALVVLKEGQALENKYFKYYKNAISFQLEDEYSYNQYWAPIAALVGAAKKIYISADGVYHQINLNTLRKPAGNYLVEDIQFVSLSSTRALANKKGSSTKLTFEEGMVAELFGFPDYGEGNQLAALPGTKKEVAEISTILQGKNITVQQYLATDASEGQVKDTKNPLVLHIATHGFFLEDLSPSQQGLTFGIQAQKAIEQPLLRSGLMLADAESAINQVETREIAFNNNGILTAYEAMALPLDKTHLVVLSACETGLGDVKAGEGVYGLQRAFQIAGAGTIVMSLWKVSDEATQLLMTSFYKRWLQSGDSQLAFREAQIALKKELPEPYHWGAFVMLD